VAVEDQEKAAQILKESGYYLGKKKYRRHKSCLYFLLLRAKSVYNIVEGGD